MQPGAVMQTAATRSTPVSTADPPRKWAGGKRWLIKYLQPIWKQHSNCRLVEPLCGGLAVTLGLRPKTAVLNDINEHLMNFYRWLKRGLEIELPLRNDSVTYYAHRKRFNQLILHGTFKEKEAAELFYYLNRTGFNGLCRFNRSGLYNVPFGQYKKINYRRDFSMYRSILRQYSMHSGDFVALSLKPGDFVYADPPYDVEFTQYSKEAFGWNEQIRLARWLAGHSGPVVLSNQATDRIVKLYQSLGFHLEFYKAPRMISSTGDRTPATEVLAVKNI